MAGRPAKPHDDFSQPIQSPRPATNLPEHTVSRAVPGDHAAPWRGAFERVRVRGEISGLSSGPRSGHLYMALKDENGGAGQRFAGVAWRGA